MPQEVEVPGVGVMEFPDGMSQADMKAAIQRHLSKAPQGAGSQTATQQPVAAADAVGQQLGDTVREVGRLDSYNDKWRGRAGSLLQGATFGFSDELVAGINALFGGDYDKSLAEERAVLEGARAREPLTSLGLELAGGIAVPGIGAAAAIKPGAGIVANGLRLAGIGAAEGGLEGFARGEGGLQNRLASGATGATVGALAAPVLTGLASVTGRAGRALGDILGIRAEGRTDDVAAREIGRALDRANIDPTDLTSRMATDADAGLQGNALLDVARPLQDLAGTVSRKPGQARELLQDFLDARQMQQGERLGSYLDDVFQPGKTGGELLDEIAKRQQATALPLYRQADDVMLPTDKLQPFLSRKVFREAYDQARRIADAEGLDLPALPVGDAFPAALPTRWIDQTKRGLDAIIEGETDALTGKVTAYGRAVGNMKRDLLALVDSLNPAYRTAREAWAGESALRDAFNVGRTFAKETPETFAAKLDGLTPSEIQAVRVGVVDSLKEAMAAKGDTSNKVALLFGSPKKRELLRALFPDRDAFDRLQFLLEREGVMARARGKVAGGSPTAERQLAEGDLEAGMGLASNLVQGRFGAAIGNLMGDTLDVVRGLGERSREKIAGHLTTSNPERIVELLRRIQAQTPGLFARPATYGAGAAATAAGAVAQ